MLVIVILLAAVMAYLFVLSPGDEDEGLPDHVTYNQLLNDIEVSLSEGTMNFKSFDSGDEIYVKGTIESLDLTEVPSPSYSTLDPGTYTVIYFENTRNNLLGDIYNGFAIKGDYRSNYTVGEEAEITLHITEITISDTGSSEFVQEWQDAAFASIYVVPYIISLEFTEVTPGTGNYTGSLTSGSEVVPLDNLDIEIYDFSATSYGYDDGDLSDDSPEVINTYSSNFVLEYTDVNGNGQMDTSDTINVYNAGPGDYIEISYDWDTLTTYTFT